MKLANPRITSSLTRAELVGPKYFPISESIFVDTRKNGEVPPPTYRTAPPKPPKRRRRRRCPQPEVALGPWEKYDPTFANV